MNGESRAAVCNRAFDEALLSGYIDSCLPQVEAQKVRLHLEDCASCRGLFEELLLLRDSTLTTQFVTPSDHQWPELPRSRTSWLYRNVGWGVIGSWILAVGVIALWRLLSQGTDPVQVFLILGLPGGGLLLGGSVLLDRLRDLKTDRYKDIQR